MNFSFQNFSHFSNFELFFHAMILFCHRRCRRHLHHHHHHHHHRYHRYHRSFFLIQALAAFQVLSSFTTTTIANPKNRFYSCNAFLHTSTRTKLHPSTTRAKSRSKSKSLNSPLTSSSSSPSSSSLYASSSIPSSFTFASQSIEYELKPSMSSISPQLWNSFLAGNDNDSTTSNPFMEYAWLHTLEETNCVSPTTGWMPQHIELKMNGAICAYIPLYIKSNSMGEFIFDAEWAQYAQDMHIKYYPKLLCAVPFTPVSCTKILMSPGLRFMLSQLDMDDYVEEEENEGIGGGDIVNGNSNSNSNSIRQGEREFRLLVTKIIKTIATSNNLSSVHMNFISDEEALDIAGPLPVPNFFSTESEDEREDKDDRNDDGNVSNNEENCNGDNNVIDTLNKDEGTNDRSDDGTNTNNNNSAPIQERVKSVFSRIVKRDNKNDLYIRRTSLQYHWLNINRNNHNLPYTSFDDYLNCFKSKKRITIKRERRRVLQEQNIIVDAIVGRDIRKYPGLVERMFEIYKSTVDKMFFGRQYLTLEFFQGLVHRDDFIDNLLFMCARHNNTADDDDNNDNDNYNGEFKAENIFAGTFNIVKDDVFYGRYWGCLPGYESKNLHFEVCYWAAIEYCIANNYKRIEPGAGGGDYKWARGFDPQLIHSAHYISQPAFRKAVQQYVQFDSERNIAIAELLNERSAVLKQKTVGKKG